MTECKEIRASIKELQTNLKSITTELEETHASVKNLRVLVLRMPW